MKRVKVTVTAILTLSPGVELIEDFISEDESLGAHLKVADQLYCPFMEWMVFQPRRLRSPSELEQGLGHGYRECEDDTVFDQYFAEEEFPLIDHSIEIIEG
jgi:hypothetical protein